MKTDELNESERRFVAAYVSDAAGDYLTAARLAGCAEPEREGALLMRRDVILGALVEAARGHPYAERQLRRYLSGVFRGDEVLRYEAADGGRVTMPAPMVERLMASEHLAVSMAWFPAREPRKG